MSTALGVSCILSVIATAGVVSVGTQALLLQQPTQSAADLAALSAAAAQASGNGEACAVAEAFARANRVTVSSCVNDGEMVRVGVEKLGRTATATAGPTDAAGG